MPAFRYLGLVALGVAAALPVACQPDRPLDSTVSADRPEDDGIVRGKADGFFENGPLYITGAFDGSKSFRMWVDTIDFARRTKRDYEKTVAFTYFINTCYFDTEVEGSWIGTAQSEGEVSARWAIAQQAINEGHEIGNHAVRHQDGSAWSEAQWHAEIQEFHDLVEQNLFDPVYGRDGQPVFPRYEPKEVAGVQGAACIADDDCESGMCLPVTDRLSVCSASCNSRNPCDDGLECGAPDWRTSKDVCLPSPAFPVVHEGETLFYADGRPNLESEYLRPYRIVGFRAPQLGHNSSLFRVLSDFNYTYDTSKVLRPGPPARVNHGGETFEKLFEFALMRNAGSLTIPMDYNYEFKDGSYERMLADYKRSIVDAYNERGREPWNIGHHFALWRGGAYWRAMQHAIEFAAEGCPNASGERQCEQVAFPTFEALARRLQGPADGVDPFLDVEVPEDEADHGASCPCGSEDHG